MLFTSFVWGTRHAGLNGQRVTNAISCIHRSLGSKDYLSHKTKTVQNCSLSSTDSSTLAPFNTLNYSDDFADVEESYDRSNLSFKVMGYLLEDLGFAESVDKAVAPCQLLTYLEI